MIARPWRLPCLAAHAALLVASCGLPTADQPTLFDDREVPFGLLEEPAPTTTTSAPARPPSSQLTICLFVDEHLTEVRRPGLPGPEGVLAALSVGTTPDERDRGLTTEVFDLGAVRSLQSSAGVVTVDLARVFTEAGPTDQLQMIAELVCSLTAQPGVGQVSFTLENQPAAVPRGDGSTTPDPVTREDYRELLA